MKRFLSFRFIGRVGAAALAAAMYSAAASAAPVTVDFTGTVSAVDFGLSSQFSAGDTITGSFTYNSATAAVGGSTSTTSVFDALTALSFSFNSGFSASSNAAPEVQMGNQDGVTELTDRFAVVSRASDGLTGSPNPINGALLDSFIFRLDDPSGTIFSDALVLPNSINLSNFATSFFDVFFELPTGGPPLEVSGSLTSAQTVPEPMALVVFGSGLIGLGWLRRKRSA